MEEEKGEAEQTEEAQDSCAARDPQAVGAHHAPKDDLDDDDGKAKADGKLRNEGSRHRDHRDNEQRGQLDVQAAPLPIGSRVRGLLRCDKTVRC